MNTLQSFRCSKPPESCTCQVHDYNVLTGLQRCCRCINYEDLFCHPNDNDSFSESCAYCSLKITMKETRTWYKNLGHKHQCTFIMMLVKLCPNIDILIHFELLLEQIFSVDTVIGIMTPLKKMAKNIHPLKIPKCLTKNHIDILMIECCLWFIELPRSLQLNFLESLFDANDVSLIHLLYREVHSTVDLKIRMYLNGLLVLKKPCDYLKYCIAQRIHRKFEDINSSTVMQALDSLRDEPITFEQFEEENPVVTLSESKTYTFELFKSCRRELMQQAIIAYSPVSLELKLKSMLLYLPMAWQKLLSTESNIPTSLKIIKAEILAKFEMPCESPALCKPHIKCKKPRSLCESEKELKVLASGTVLKPSIVRQLTLQVKTDPVILNSDIEIVEIGPYVLTLHDALQHVKNDFCYPRVDFVSICPKSIRRRIFSYLDYDSLLACMQVSQRWQNEAIEIIEERSPCLNPKDAPSSKKDAPSSKKDAPSSKKDKRRKSVVEKEVTEQTVEPLPTRCFNVAIELNASYAQDVYIDVLCKTFKAASVHCDSTIRTVKPILVEARNVFCTSYVSRILIDTIDVSRVVHNDGSSLIAVTSLGVDLMFYSLRTANFIPTKLVNANGFSATCLQIISNGSYIYVGGYDAAVGCWSLKTGKCLKTFVGFRDVVTCLQVYNQYLVVGCKDGIVKLWDQEVSQLLHTAEHNHSVITVAVSELLWLAGCQTGCVVIRSTKSGKLIKHLTMHEHSITSLKADRWFIIIASQDTVVQVWDAPCIFNCLHWLSHPKPVTCIDMMYMRIISGCEDGLIRIWNCQTGDLMKMIYPLDCDNPSPIRSFSISDNWIIINTVANVQMLCFQPIERKYLIHPKTSPVPYELSDDLIKDMKQVAQLARITPATSRKVTTTDSKNTWLQLFMAARRMVDFRHFTAQRNKTVVNPVSHLLVKERLFTSMISLNSTKLDISLPVAKQVLYAYHHALRQGTYLPLDDGLQQNGPLLERSISVDNLHDKFFRKKVEKNSLGMLATFVDKIDLLESYWDISNPFISKQAIRKHDSVETIKARIHAQLPDEPLKVSAKEIQLPDVCKKTDICKLETQEKKVYAICMSEEMTIGEKQKPDNMETPSKLVPRQLFATQLPTVSKSIQHARVNPLDPVDLKLSL